MADDVVIRAEGLGKKYMIGHQVERERYVALRDVVARAGRNVAQKALDLVHGRPAVPGPAVEEFWALKDIDFEIKRGQAVGIIGRNGAGKSTLLKILSRITEPTTGRVTIKGKVASLLEVGTGFHPELTGRENIYLNGAILGMRRAEIRKKFDEIVAFAEVDKFLDTPVKRYSSGMYVRLAFAVAAHLETEVLVVDEVLAVGDFRFQQKCLGKMDEVTRREGRTVLLVSHNLAAVNSLATNGIFLDGGRLVFEGEVGDSIRAYSKMQDRESVVERGEGNWGVGKHTAIKKVTFLDGNGQSTGSYTPGDSMKVLVTFETDGSAGLSLELFLLDQKREKIGMASLHQFHSKELPTIRGLFCCELALPALWLASGTYFLDVTTSIVNVSWDHYVDSAVRFEVLFSNAGGESWDFKQSSGYGCLALPFAEAASFMEEKSD
jgi:lipopolysaccharide transport system ATP-binding protein